MPIQIDSEVQANRENVTGYTANNSPRCFHPGQKLVVVALGLGLAVCRPFESLSDDLVSIQTADLEVW